MDAFSAILPASIRVVHKRKMDASMTSTDIEIVQAFHDRLNARDVDGLLALAADEIQVGGPRGTGNGKHLVAEWVARANVTMQPQRWFHRGRTVIVEQRAVWHGPDGGGETGSQTVATVFALADGAIASIARYGNIGEAVTSADMDETDEIAAPSG